MDQWWSRRSKFDSSCRYHIEKKRWSWQCIATFPLLDPNRCYTSTFPLWKPGSSNFFSSPPNKTPLLDTKLPCVIWKRLSFAIYVHRQACKPNQPIRTYHPLNQKNTSSLRSEALIGVYDPSLAIILSSWNSKPWIWTPVKRGTAECS